MQQDPPQLHIAAQFYLHRLIGGDHRKDIVCECSAADLDRPETIAGTWRRGIVHEGEIPQALEQEEGRTVLTYFYTSVQEFNNAI